MNKWSGNGTRKWQINEFDVEQEHVCALCNAKFIRVIEMIWIVKQTIYFNWLPQLDLIFVAHHLCQACASIQITFPPFSIHQFTCGKIRRNVLISWISQLFDMIELASCCLIQTILCTRDGSKVNWKHRFFFFVRNRSHLMKRTRATPFWMRFLNEFKCQLYWNHLAFSVLCCSIFLFCSLHFTSLLW